MYHAEQRGSGARQATQTSVATAQDSHTDQTALQLGHRALPVPQPDSGEAATRAEEATHVLAHLLETVTEVSKQSTSYNPIACSLKLTLQRLRLSPKLQTLTSTLLLQSSDD